MRRIVLAILILAAVASLVTSGLWYLTRKQEPRDQIVLSGNLDLRQVNLAFDNSERIAEVLVEEGDRVRRGQLVASLDTQRLKPQVGQVEAQVLAQKAVVERLHNGSRPEEIAEAKATLESSRADARNAAARYNRLKDLAVSSGGRAVSQQDMDDAQALLDVMKAKVEVSQKALDLMVAGPRREDIAQGEAQLQAYQAQLAYLRQQLADAELHAPTDAVVRSRLMEPGEMASPQRAVLSLAVTDPKWVRAYVSETDLNLLRPGMSAAVYVDSFPGRAFEGWVGFISSVAEFTPKSVETRELRPKLVYEVRVFVKDPGDELRLGSPATVVLSRPATAGERRPTTSPATTEPIGQGVSP